MKVLLCNNFVRQGSGIDTSVQIEERALERLGHEVHTFRRDNQDLDRTTGLQKLALLASCLYSLPVRREIEQVLAETPFDVVHIHNAVPLMTGAIYDACRRFPVLTIQHLRNYRAFCLNSYAYRNDQPCHACTESVFAACAVFRCYRESYVSSASLTVARWLDVLRGRTTGYGAHAYIANSAFTKQQHVDYGLPEDRVWVLHNPAHDLSRLLPAGTTPRFTGKKKIVYVGSLLRAKGVYAAVDLARHLPEFEVHLVGAGQEQANLHRVIAAQGLTNVVLAGLREGESKAQIWADSFVTLVPSLWNEPFGLVAPESFSLHVPVVTTGSGGLKEIVQQGETGFLQSFRRPHETAELLRALWDDPDRYQHMRESARASYDQYFTEDAYARRLNDMLTEILERWQAPGFRKRRQEMFALRAAQPANTAPVATSLPFTDGILRPERDAEAVATLRPAAPVPPHEHALRMLICNNFVRHGSGVDAVVASEERALLALGHDVHLYRRDNHELDTVNDVAMAGLVLSGLYSHQTLRELRMLLDHNNFELLHLHNMVPLLTGAVYDACVERNVLTVQHLHNYRAYCLSSYAYRADHACRACQSTAYLSCAAYRCYRRSVLWSSGLAVSRWFDCLKGRRAGYAADAYIACSEWVKQRHVEYGLPADDIFVVPNPSQDLRTLLEHGAGDSVADTGTGARRHRTMQVPEKRITYVGAMLTMKGVHLLPELARHLPEFEIHVMGAGDEEQALRHAARSDGLRNLVMHGFTDGRAKAELWSPSFLTVLPSLWEEPFPITALESLSLGVPLLTTGVGGLSDLVQGGSAGMTCDLRDARDAAAQVRALWDDQLRWQAMSAAARARYEDEYEERHFGTRLADALLEIRATRRPARHRTRAVRRPSVAG